MPEKLLYPPNQLPITNYQLPITNYQQVSQMSEKLLYPLLDYLAQGHRPADNRWQNWQISQISGGANNLPYRASSPDGDFAVKFTIRDRRDRAGREYGALLALWG
jgi:hypothetical protein